MKAAFYQFSPVFGKKKENLEKVTGVLGASDVKLVVLPELFATGYQFADLSEVSELAESVPDGPTTVLLSDISRRKNMYVVAGLPERSGGKFYNSAVLTGPKGFIGTYRKTHLYFEEKHYFSPGDTGFRVWDTGVGRIGIMICFDWFFPESARTLALAAADIIAHPSNLVLPFCPQSMPVRCLENRVFAITANRTGWEERKEGQKLSFIGQSQIVAPDSRILIRATETEEVLMSADIDPNKARDKSLNYLNDIFNDRRPDMYPVTCLDNGNA